MRGPVEVAEVAFRRAADDVVRLAAGGAAADERGDVDLARPPPFAALFALRNGEAVRLTTGGVAVRETGGVGR